MAFQFLCPNGHILQGDPAHGGRTINCPVCGILFVIPTVQTPPDIVSVPPASSSMLPFENQAEPSISLDDDLLDIPQRGRRLQWFNEGEESAEEESDDPTMDDEHQTPLPDVADDASPSGSGIPQMVHIDCPNGHELITSTDTMEQDVLCPFCGEQFVLHYVNSKEYKLAKWAKQERLERKVGQRWLIWAIVAGVGVLIMLVVMAIYSSRR